MRCHLSILLSFFVAAIIAARLPDRPPLCRDATSVSSKVVLESEDKWAITRSYKELNDQLCTRELFPKKKNKKMSNYMNSTTGVKFMVLMESGRVGSSWLVSLLRRHSMVPSCIGEGLASSHAANMSWTNIVAYYNQTIPHGTAIGAKQKKVALVHTVPELKDGRTLLEHMIDDFGVRIVCLARSNPIESYLADVNGDAHQDACHAHNHRETDDCYSDEDARSVFSETIWKNRQGHYAYSASPEQKYQEEAQKNVTLKPEFTCNIHSHLVRTLRFHEVCNDLVENHDERVFWLEYSDLSCRFEETMRAILNFLELPYENLQVPISKLTKDLRNLIPYFDELVNALRADEYISRGALSSALLYADNCDYMQRHRHVAAFCPLRN